MNMTNPGLALVFAALSLGALSSARAAVETYAIDPVHTWVGFNSMHFFTKVPGFFGSVNGNVVVDREHMEKSTVEAVMQTASITTNTGMRDADLRSANFFNVEKFPTMTFKSTAWKHKGGNQYAVTGNLTIKGVTKPVVLKVASTGFGPGMKGASISGWEVSATIDRRDFGITADEGLIGNQVEVVIHVEADLATTVPAKK
jgi:polyisoprenoid-binding protein YceI